MNVLHVISNIDPRAGGTASAMSGLAVAQARAGMKVRVISTWKGVRPDSAEELLRNAAIDVRLVGPARTPLQLHPALSSGVRGAVFDADVIHIHAMWEQIQVSAAMSAQSLGRPYVIAPHGMLDPWSLSQSRWRKKIMLALRARRMLNSATAIHYTTEAEQEGVRPLQLRTPAIIEPNGLDASEFVGLEHIPQRLSERYGVNATKTIVFLGRLHHKKGIDLTIRALARMTRREIALVIAGPDDDGEQANLQRLADSLNLKNIRFLGMVSGREKLELLADADLFVLSSHQENFGIGVIESLAAGTPVVISDRVNLCDAVKAAGVGAVTSLEPNDIAAALSRWLELCEPELRARAQRFAREQFDWGRIARRWGDHYQSMISTSAATTTVRS